MSERTAVYKEKLNSSHYGTYKIYRISKTKLVGADAMSEVGTPCPDWVEVGWHYNESSNVFLSPEEYEEQQKQDKQQTTSEFIKGSDSPLSWQ